MEAKLQHPLDVAYNEKDHCLYVADTYNHKIKKIDLHTNTATTCNITNSGAAVQFNEPGGLCVSPKCDKLLIANTNNHTIEIVSLDDFTSETLKLQFTFGQTIDLGLQLKLPNALKCRSADTKIRLLIDLEAIDDVKFTIDAPQKWSCILPNNQWSASLTSGPLERADDNNETEKILYKTNVELIAAENSIVPQENENLTVTFKLSLCALTSDVCYPKVFSLLLPIIYAEDGADNLEENIHVSVSENDVHIT